MGRETKLLLALLATLAGVFVGVLSMKLLSPRPPAGAGPDVHVDVAAVEPHELVVPPSLSPPPGSPGTGDRYSAGGSGFASASADSTAAEDVGQPVAHAAPRRDPFVATASLEQPLSAPAQPLDSKTDVAATRAAAGSAPSTAVAMPRSERTAIEPPGLPPHTAPTAITATASPSPPPPTYVTASGDSWWDLAERAYGDGRLYRALFAWNRVVDPRVSLTPGTRLEIPPRERLEAAWPKLVPPR